MLKKILNLIDFLDIGYIKVVTFLILLAIIETLSVGIFIPLINLVFKNDFIGNLNSEFYKFTGIAFEFSFNLIIILFFLIFLFKFFFNIYLNYQIHTKIFSIKSLLSNRLFDSYVKKKFIDILKYKKSHYTANIINETQVVIYNTIKPFFTFLSDILILISISIFLFILYPVISLICFTFFLIMSYFYYLFFKNKLKLIGSIRRESEEKRFNFLNVIASSIREFKVYNKEKFISNSFKTATLKVDHNLKLEVFFNTLPKLIIELTIVLLLSIFLISKFSSLEDNVEIIKILGIFAVAAFKLLPTVTRMINAFQSIKYSESSLDLIISELYKSENTKEIDVKHTKTKSDLIIPSNWKKIVFKNVSLSFGTKKVINNFNFELYKNNFIGIMGRSGSGKTTLINTLAGLIEPSSGDILIDNDISIFDQLKIWQSKVGLVPQKISVFKGSLIKNIEFFSETNQMDEEKIKKVLRDVDLTDFIKNFKEKNLYEDGQNISGGQLQRLGIARALFRNPEILLFDEITNGLDTTSENNVLETINKLKGNITIIMISHKEKNLENCDRIINLENFV